MAITFFGSANASSASTNGGVNTLSVTMPTLIEDNDIAIVAVAKGSNQTVSMTLPSGFTEVATQTSIPNSTTLALDVFYYRLTSAASGSTVTASWATAAYSDMAVAVYRGVSKFTALDATPTTATSASATTLPYPAITTNSPTTDIVRIAGTLRTATGAGYTHTEPLNHVERVDVTSSRANSANVGLTVVDSDTTTAGTYPSVSGTVSVASTSSLITISLRDSANDPVYSRSGSGSILLTGTAGATQLLFSRSGSGSILLTATSSARQLSFSRTASGSILLTATNSSYVTEFPFIGWGRPI